jgi:uncharacterized protein YjbI with pentapeptide repeats
MADSYQVSLLRQGTEVWNKWRSENPSVVRPDFTWAELNDIRIDSANLDGAQLNHAKLNGASMSRTSFVKADLRSAEIRLAYFIDADLRSADFRQSMLMRTSFDKSNLEGALFDNADAREVGFWGASLVGASFARTNLMRADFTRANLTGANLSEAELSYAIFVDANLQEADVSGSSIYGISVWNCNVAGTNQKALAIGGSVSALTVDDLQLAQFVFLLLGNERLRDVLETVSKKAVLILGRFTPERKAILDAIRDELRRFGYLPLLFDWAKPTNRDLTETISALAHLSRFIIADITDAKSIPQELQSIVPNLPSVVVRPIIVHGQAEYAMFDHFRRYPWVLPLHQYHDAADLLATFKDNVISPVETKLAEIPGYGTSTVLRVSTE